MNNLRFVFCQEGLLKKIHCQKNGSMQGYPQNLWISLCIARDIYANCLNFIRGLLDW